MGLPQVYRLFVQIPYCLSRSHVFMRSQVPRNQDLNPATGNPEKTLVSAARRRSGVSHQSPGVVSKVNTGSRKHDPHSILVESLF